MTLIICKECGNSISDKSNICPKCGYPTIKTKNTKYKVYTAMLIASFLITCITIYILKQEWDYRRTVDKYNQIYEK